MKYIIGHLKPDLDSVVAPLALKYLFNQKDCYGHKNQTQAVIAEKANNETQFVFDKFKAQLPTILDRVGESDQFILVDHNEADQRFPGMQDDQVIEIYDHHKLALNLTNPIFVTTKPWGSSNTIIWQLMQINNVVLDKTLASLMICAILSDTVGFRGPTTTDKDKEAVKALNQVAQITNIDDLILEIFKAKSNIKNLTPTQIVKNDYKVVNLTGHKVFIDQIETVQQDEALAQKSQLLKAMEEIKKAEGVEYLFVIITDVLKINSKALYLTQEDQVVLEKAFGSIGKDNLIDIGPRLSRKKEILPAIENALKK